MPEPVQIIRTSWSVESAHYKVVEPGYKKKTEKKTFNKLLNLYSPGARADNPRGQNYIVTKKNIKI